MVTLAHSFFILNCFILAGFKDMPKSFNDFECPPEPTTNCGVSCP